MYHFHDVLIIGGGGSGISLAIKLKQMGIKDVAIISKTNIMGSHTSAAKGGINATLSSVHEDNYKWHMFDTVKSAAHMADEERVEFMCKNAPNEIEFLQKQGVKFDKLENGALDQRKYGGQKTNFGKGDFAYRSCFASDKTGYEIMKNLEQNAKNNDIKMYQFYFAFDAKKDGETTNIYALNLKDGRIESFGFKVLVFAGGGFSQNFYTNSSSSLLSGDCHVLALKLGGKLEDMEFVQFHPTGLYGCGILISEAVRAEGGYLLNKAGERFMYKYSPDFLELAPRDVIARAIFAEGNGKDPAFLSVKHIPAEVIRKKLSGTILTAKFFAKIDIFKEDIPVFPTAHYNMGGIKVDYNYKMEESNNIFAIGECAGSRIHGANRLGCNSLLELFTSSTLACANIINILPHIPKQNSKLEYRFPKTSSNKKISFSEILKMKIKLGLIMDEKCGVLREGRLLSEALDQIKEMIETVNDSSPLISSLVFSNEFVAFHELSHLLTLSLEVVKSAIYRTESRGSHMRLDYPMQKNDFNRF